jgi:hypothetical protein
MSFYSTNRPLIFSKSSRMNLYFAAKSSGRQSLLIQIHNKQATEVGKRVNFTKGIVIENPGRML